MTDNDSIRYRSSSVADPDKQLILSLLKTMNQNQNSEHEFDIPSPKKFFYEYHNESGFQSEYLQKLKVYGYLIIFLTWFLFIISIGTLFNLWQWCFKVDPTYFKYLNSISWIKVILEDIEDQNKVVDNYYICIFFLNFVIFWIWAVVSWISMKLFRHSKGGGS
jgi:hypothetical protein